MTICKLPSGKFINLDNITAAAQTTYNDKPVFAVNTTDSQVHYLKGEDAEFMTQVLDGVTIFEKRETK